MTPTVARQMIGAEILKLRRNRGLMAFAVLLSVGVAVIVFGFTAVEHASNPHKYGPAGGIDGFGRAVQNFGLYFGMLTGILIGAEAGTADISSGVFRDLVATGRSRTALFLVRVPAAIATTLTLVAAAFAVTLIATFALAGGTATPGLSLILESAGWIALASAIVVTLAVGIGSLTGSRAVTLTAVIGWQTVATNLLLNVTVLGSVRGGLLTASLAQLMPVRGDIGVTVATGTAIAVLIGWIALPTVIGAWRSRTQDA
jgi:hypothetical protein